MNYRLPRLCVLAIIAGAVWQVSRISSAEDSYTPGPVVVLHTWLGEQCSFVPDLDVGECCADHDIAYQIGGSETDRGDADLAFRTCIRSEGRPIVAFIYYWGVRLFGWLFFNYTA